MKYTVDEIQYLELNWQTKSHLEMSLHLGRKERSVRNFLSRKRWLKIKKWTGSEIEQLRNFYNIPNNQPLNLVEASKVIGRSRLSLENKANELGIANSHRDKVKKPLELLSRGRRVAREWANYSKEEKKQRLSQMRKDYIRDHGHPRGKRVIRTCPVCGKFFDIESSSPQKYCSTACARQRLRREITYTRGKGGRRADLNNIYFRSSWEANYARYLNFLIQRREIVKWEFEPETFWFEKIKRGVRSYKPDFKVFCNGGLIEYHEVKGWDYPRGKTARKRMAKYHPQIRMILIDEQFFKDVRKNHLDKLIPGWEYKNR